MKMKKLVSAIAALAMATSALAGFATIAGAEGTSNATLVADTSTYITDDGKFAVNGNEAEGVLIKFDASAIKNAAADASEVIESATLTYNVLPETSNRDGDFRVYVVNDEWDGSAVDMAGWKALSRTLVFSGWSGIKTTYYAPMSIDVKSAVENDADGIITFAITLNNARRQFIEPNASSLAITTVAATPTTVTVNKVDADGNPISSETVENVYVGDPYTATDAQKTVAPVEADGTKAVYTYNAAASTESIDALAASGNELTLVFDKTILNAAGAVTVNYAIDGAVVDTKSVDVSNVYETENYSYYYPAYITNDGKLYKANASTYGETLAATADAVTKTVEYVAADDVVFFMEAEDITDITNKNTTWTNSPSTNYSNGNAVTVAKTDAYMAVTVEITESGKYRFDGVYGSGSTRKAHVYLNDEQVITAEAANNAGGAYSYEAELAAGTYTYKVAAEYSTLPSMDYFTVTKTGEYTPAPTTLVGTIAKLAQFSGEEYKNEATALTATFEAPEDVTFETVVLTYDGTEYKNAATVTGGTVVYGIVINKIVADTDITAVAK